MASWSLRSAGRDDQVRGSNLPEVTWPVRGRAETSQLRPEPRPAPSASLESKRSNLGLEQGSPTPGSQVSTSLGAC